MKHCPQCGQRYTDTNINFCLNDGELLTNFADSPPPTIFGNDPLPSQYEDDQPPTVMMDPSRITNQTHWPQGGPMATYDTNRPHMQNMPYSPPAAYAASRDQTLPIASIALAVASLVMICCFGGIWLGVPAVVLGIFGMRNAGLEPDKYEGRGLAIAGIVIGAVTFILSFIHLFVSIIAN